MKTIEVSELNHINQVVARTAQDLADSGISTPSSGGTWGRRGGWRRPTPAATSRQVSTEAPSYTAFESVSAAAPKQRADVFSMSTIEESATDYKGVRERTKMA